MRDYKKLLESGNKAQLEKLLLYKEKGEFPTDLYLLILLLKAEYGELLVELYLKDYKAIRKEFADIANYAHMGILACDKELEK